MIDLLGLIIILIFLGFFYWGFTRTMEGPRPPKLSRREARELEQLRAMRDKLLMDALDNVEVEPFAVTVIDTIRETQKEINK